MGRTVIIVLLLTAGWLVIRSMIARARVETEKRKALERELNKERAAKRSQEPRSVKDARFRDVE